MKKLLIYLDLVIMICFVTIFNSKINVLAKEDVYQNKIVATDAELRAYAKALGFNISEDFIFSSNATCEPTFTDSLYSKELLQYEVRIYDFVLENKYNKSIYAYIFKIHLSPQDGRYGGILGIGSHGGQYVNGEVNIKLPRNVTTEFLDYAPKNNPSTTTSTIGVSIGTSGFDISAAVDYSHSELEVISGTNFGQNIYDTTYRFSDLGNGYSKYSNYQKGDVDLFGMLLLKFDYELTVIPEYKITFYEVSSYGDDAHIVRNNILEFK